MNRIAINLTGTFKMGLLGSAALSCQFAGRVPISQPLACNPYSYIITCT